MFFGACISLVVAASIYMSHRPALQLWHKTVLDGEFTADSRVADFHGYLALEDALFKQLDDKILQRLPTNEWTKFNRFSSGSRSDPAQWPINWNRTFELQRQDARFGVLLLHGYSDSPYSLRAIGKTLHARGGHVLGLRLPGHGTIPSALRRTKIEDMSTAVSLATAHLQKELPDKPIIIIGYSNGAALALHHTFSAINSGQRFKPAALVLISPEIGISPIAALSSWQAWVGEVLGIDELAWNSVAIEFDPFKYNSFAVNAGAQAYRMTALVQEQLDALASSGLLRHVPPVLAFQSKADATVTASAVKLALFDRLDSDDAELVLFDVNRVFKEEGLIDAPAEFNTVLSGAQHKYAISVVTNRDDQDLAAVVHQRLPMSDVITTGDLGTSWPREVYSLAHIAIPFPADDPLYGVGTRNSANALNLGHSVLRGEKGRLKIPDSAMTRQRWNPFYRYMEKRILELVDRTTSTNLSE